MAGLAVSLALAACGSSSARQNAHEASGKFDVDIPSASFPATQALSEHTRMTITVRNADTGTIPDFAVTISGGSDATDAQPFAASLSTSGSNAPNASSSRPVWIVDRPPGLGGCGYSCQQGGAGGAVTAYTNTWALGSLAPGRSVTFTWGLTAVKAGVHEVSYRVAAGLNGNARAQLADGRPPAGVFRVTIRTSPTQSYVNHQGQVVNAP